MVVCMYVCMPLRLGVYNMGPPCPLCVKKVIKRIRVEGWEPLLWNFLYFLDAILHVLQRASRISTDDGWQNICCMSQVIKGMKESGRQQTEL